MQSQSTGAILVPIWISDSIFCIEIIVFELMKVCCFNDILFQ